MIDGVEGAWLFLRGNASVRISRRADARGEFVLVIHGPGTDLSVFHCANLATCMERQQDVERRLLAEGYFLNVQATERRRGAGEARTGASERRSLRPTRDTDRDREQAT